MSKVPVNTDEEQSLYASFALRLKNRRTVEGAEVGTLIPRAYLLCDCNNFYVSCERIFRPDLDHKPVIVLSNNDGCVVARSNEVKALGIPRGIPVFKIKNEIKRHHIEVFSSNFPLYINISSRVMRLLRSFSEHISIYSVDEAFLRFDNLHEQELTELSRRIRRTVADRLGIPLGIGIATSKTLAKLANHHAKSHSPVTGGVHNAVSKAQRELLLLDNPIEEIWGIGSRLSEKLRQDEIRTAYDLSLQDPTSMRKRYSINLERTIRELNGEDVIADDPDSANQAQIMWARTFGKRLTEFDDIYEGLANYTAEAAAKLRSLGKYCKKVTVHLTTSMFGDGPKYAQQITLNLDYPTCDTRILLKAAHGLLAQIYIRGYLYAKAGILLSDLTDSRTYQGDLFVSTPDSVELIRAEQAMQALDRINLEQKNLIHMAAQGKLAGDRRFLDQKFKSQRYTTCWDELPVVR